MTAGVTRSAPPPPPSLGAVAARLADERLEKTLVVLHLRVPEDADREAPTRVLEALERAVLGPGRLDEPLPHPADALMVARLHGVVTVTEDLGESRPSPHVHRVLRERPEHLTVAVVADGVREVLHEVPAADDVEELEAAADRERRDVALQRAAEQRHLAGVAVSLRRVGPLVPLGAVGLGADVDAAREDDAVEDIERVVHPVDGRRDDERAAPGPLDRLDVVVGDECRRELPRAPPRGLRVRGDADDRPAAHAGNVAQSWPDNARVESTQAASAGPGGAVSPARAPR